MPNLAASKPALYVHAGGTLNLDYNVSRQALVLLQADMTLFGFPNWPVGGSMRVRFKQDLTGGRAVVPANVVLFYPRGAVAYAAAPNAVTDLVIYRRGSLEFDVYAHPLPDETPFHKLEAVIEAAAGVLVSDAAKLNVNFSNFVIANAIAAGLAALNDPIFTGNPRAPTPAPGDNDTSIATTAFVQAALAAMVDAAPGALDTLNELAAALGDDANFAATVTAALAGKQAGHANLTALAALASIANLAAIANQVSAADKISYWTGAGTAGLADLSAFMRTLFDDPDASTMLGTLGFSAFFKTLIDDADAPALRASLDVPGRNYLENASFSVWQENITYAIGGGTNQFVADRWKARRASTSATFSRQAGFSGSLYCLRMGRDVGDATVNSIILGQQIESQLAVQLGGKAATLSFDLRKGADYSGGNLGITIATGTGIDEAVNLNSGAFTTGSAPQAPGGVTPQAAATRHSISATIPAGATEIAVKFGWVPVGVAGANDYLEITNVKLEEGTAATRFEAANPADNMERCLRHYEKSFSLGVVPAQNVGAGAGGTGEEVWAASAAGAVVQRASSVHFKARKRATPAITLYNPAAANAQARDLTAGADTTATAASNINDRGFALAATGAAGTAAGNQIGVHWVADARL